MKKVFTKILIAPLNLFIVLVFGAYFVLLFPVYFVLIKIKRKWSHNTVQVLNKIWGILASMVSFTFLTVYGRKFLEPQKAYIVVANHSSYWDIPACTLALPSSFRFMGKVELVQVPLFGMMFREVHIPVNRGNRMEAVRSLELARQKLAEGISVLIYPEGTIPDKKTVTLGPFKDGAFRLAVESGIPILPMTLKGTDRVLPDEKLMMIRPFGRVKVKFDRPIPTSGLQPSDIPALKQQVFDLLKKNLTSNAK